VDHDNGGTTAAGINIVNAIAIDLQELAARRQRRFDLARRNQTRPAIAATSSKTTAMMIVMDVLLIF
jgi:hypothetical protein